MRELLVVPLPRQVALAVHTEHPRLFPKLWVPGVIRHQAGDAEMRAVFTAESLEQVATVIRAKRWGGTGRGRPENFSPTPGQLATSGRFQPGLVQGQGEVSPFSESRPESRDSGQREPSTPARRSSACSRLWAAPMMAATATHPSDASARRDQKALACSEAPSSSGPGLLPTPVVARRPPSGYP
jgi:hypothetical protein